jgi:arylsulfatase
VLDELDALGMTSKTIVILTADHGDLDGAHRLHGKGATAYREQNHVPLIVAHPAQAGGKRCRAVTTHLDLVPTLINLTSAAPEAKAALTKSLPGKDFSPLLAAPQKAAATAVRDGALYCYNMLAYLDGDFMQTAVEVLLQPDGRQKVAAAAKQGQLQPNLLKRGAIRSVFDGRYTFARYFSPTQHNRPTSLDALFSLNDVELFDHEKDPLEMENLALDRRGQSALLEEMNAKLNRLIDAEVGQDVGQMMPARVDGGWVATDATKDV